MDLASIRPTQLIPEPTPQSPIPESNDVGSPGTFGELIHDVLRSASAEQENVSNETGRLVTGEASSFHEISLAVARADVTFRFLMEVRDQLVGAYREVMRMQV